MSYRKKLLDLYDLFPFEHHPLWLGVKRGELSLDQVLRAETQHYLRTREGQKLRKLALSQAKSSKKIFELLFQTYMDECEDDEKSGLSHLKLIMRLLMDGGITQHDLDIAKNMPGNIAAISIYKNISDRGFSCHMLGAGTVEYFYSQLCPDIFQSYTQTYKMTSDQAETYRIHGPMDKEHAERAFEIIPEAIEIHGWDVIEESVRDAFIATSLHYDGMLQAATGNNSYWDGKK